MRLQQDTNNVLTRLSYLEATVMSIQVSFFFKDKMALYLNVVIIE